MICIGTYAIQLYNLIKHIILQSWSEIIFIFCFFDINTIVIMHILLKRAYIFMHIIMFFTYIFVHYY